MQAAGALKENTRGKYLTSIMQLSTFCEQKHLPWHTSSVPYWFADMNMGSTAKPKAGSTLLQKISHINLLTELQPPLIAGPRATGSRLVPGMGCVNTSQKDLILPPSYILTLSKLQQPQVLHVAVQFQVLSGLRVGQMSLLLPSHLATPDRIWLPPFKHQPLPRLVDIRHIPKALVQQLLAYSTSKYTPILPWTPEQYKLRFQQLAATYGLKKTSHSARHSFASIQRFLNVPTAAISRALTHEQGKSVATYLHAIPIPEQQVILDHLDYFRPIFCF